MHENVNPEISIAVDLKKYRIRIHKSTLHLLGDPRYIQLLVSPKQQAVALRGILKERSGDQSHRVPFSHLQSDNSVEIYSQRFIETLRDAVCDLDVGATYRLTGNAYLEHGVAVFPIKTLRRIDS